MASNTPNPGDDMQPDDLMPETEHTTPAAQPELSDISTPQPEAEAAPEEAVASEELAAADEVAALNHSEPEEDESSEEEEAEPEADAAPEEAVASEELTAADEVAALNHSEPEDDDIAEEEEPAEAAESAPFKRGEIVTGHVLSTSPTEVLVDLGDGVTGLLASRELERMDREALELLKPGSEVTAFVLKAKGADGQPVLSLARAEEENNWRLAETHFQSKDVYFTKIAGYNKGGLIVRFGKVRGFVPASQVSPERQQRADGQSPEERWGSMVGEDIAVKVVEIDRARNRLILSERAAAREWRERQKARLLETLTVGETRTGVVISLADFGAFVDLGGADGLVHLTEMSWRHVTHPREVLHVGQEVEVDVISIDPVRKRIGLSMKRREHDPWETVLRQYKVGQLVQATVTKLTKFGAFARLVDAPEIEGLIHISELADYRVTHPREVVLVGDVLTLRIVKIEPDQRRLGLSLRQVDSAKYMDQDWQAMSGDLGDEARAEDDAADSEVPNPDPDDDSAA